MLRRRIRPLLKKAAVGGVAYAAGHHGGKKSAEQQNTDAQQNAQIADMQQQPASPAKPAGLTDEAIAQLKQLGSFHESGILTDAEFEAAKQKILGI
jgi:hypothetical protein